VKAWYPSDIKGTAEPYLSEAEAEFVTKYLQFPDIYGKLMTNAGRDVPISSGEETYPILIFSHGWGEHFSQNTILMEELASNGYVVFSVAHHYECKFSSFPDGRLIKIDMSNARFQKIMGEMASPQAMQLMLRMYQASSDEERRQVILETSNTLPTAMTESPAYWADDISFFMDQLSALNNGNPTLKGKLNLDRIGVFGMSMGGIASFHLCMSDERAKACVNIDGGLTEATLEGAVQIPTMFLNGKRYLGYGVVFTKRSKADCYSFSVRDSDHYNLSDYSVYPVPSITMLLGTIEGRRTIEIMNDLVLAFFDRYLKERHDIDIVRQAKAYPEIELSTNLE
jgi:dienelactone hydrolase